MVTIQNRKRKARDGLTRLQRACKMISILSIGLLFIFYFGGEPSKSKSKSGNREGHENDFSFYSDSLANDEDRVIESIRRGKLQLIDMRIEGINIDGNIIGDGDGDKGRPYSALGIFCELDWSMHKSDPTSVPMFKDIVANSPLCKRTKVEADLYLAATAARDSDNNKNGNSSAVRAMQPKGFVFHESRCGSTLTANTLAAFRPNENRVYSESQPPVQVFKAFDAENEKESIQLIHDTIYLMGRTTDEKEENLFFKVQSIGSKSIGGFRKAYPDTPWIYVYRDPVQVMRSHMKVKDTHHAVCLRRREDPPKDLQRLVDRVTRQAQGTSGRKRDAKKLSTEEYCAAHLATLCEAAEKQLSASHGLGRAVNYQDLPQILVDDIIPRHFLPEEHQNGKTLTSDEIKRITKVNSKYSKGRGSRGRKWEEDSEMKEETAWDELRDASAKYLLPVYERLQKLQLKQTDTP